MDLATLSQAAFALGVILLIIGFAAHVGRAVLLANGRRSLQVLAPARTPAYAGIATGNFVTSSVRSGGRTKDSAAESPMSGAAIGVTFLAFLLVITAVLLRGIVVGRGPWGNLYEFSVAFTASIAGG